MENLKGLVRTRVNKGRIQNQTLPLSNITYRRLRSNCTKNQLKIWDNQLEFYLNLTKTDYNIVIGDYSNIIKTAFLFKF